jgi:predicted ATPase
MGLHSGEPAFHEDAYVGMDVHRAARIAATAHGGQVVLSDATRTLVEPQLPEGVSIRDLGWHRLKDIEQPEHIFQVIAAGLGEHFPALKSLGARTSLPVPPTPLVGRDADLRQLRAVVVQPGVRLVTLTGTGGVGKTRLALAGAASLSEAFQHGVFFVAMATVTDTELMWKAIAEALGVADERAAEEAATDHLRSRTALLVLDNLEHLSGAAVVVAALLASAPGLRILATSRRPLHLQGEHEQSVPALDVPRDSSVGAVTDAGAARLFVQQAAMVRPGFEITSDNAADIAAICQRLDGLPLAIELAAARAKLLGPKALLGRLNQSLDLATGDLDRPSRQQTLRATIAWSCDLLTPDVEIVFRRAGVFAGGCDLDALAAVLESDHDPEVRPDPLGEVAELLDVSLVAVSEGTEGEPRVAMLETVREYALERLEISGDLEIARRRHAAFFASFAERAKEQLQSQARLAWLDRLEIEHDNLRAALRWSLDGPENSKDDNERAVVGLRLVGALAQFWYEHGHATEGRRWLERSIAFASDDAGAPLAHVTHWLGVLLQQQGENEAALPLFERSLAIWQELDDRSEIGRELNSLGITHRHLGHPDTARSRLEESIAIARDLGDGRRLAAALNSLSHVETNAANLDRAIDLLQEALTVDQELGDALGATIDQQSLAVAVLCSGRADEAGEMLSATLDYVVASGHVEFLATTLELSAAIAAALGDGVRAAQLCGAGERIRDAATMPRPPADDDVLERFIGPARATMAASAWNAALTAGRALTQQQVIDLLAAPAYRH